jgi:glycosyltransferase involved in cell wall biosynthesis
MKNKILFILPTLPYPLTAGGNQAMFNGINSVKNDVDVFVTYSTPFYHKRLNALKAIKPLLKNVQIHPFVYNPIKGYHGFILWLFYVITILLKINEKNADYFCSLMPSLFKAPLNEYADFVNDLIKKNKIDIVQMEMCSPLSQVLSLPSSVKKIIVHHELNYVVNSLRVKQMGENFSRNANIELAKMLEIGLLNKCDAVVTLSETDKQKLINQGVKSPIYSSFAVVNTSTSFKKENEQSCELSFVGPATHIPNYIGLKWFLENCWKCLLEKDSSYVLKIIGNWPENKRNEVSHKYKNIQFLGFVPNLADSLNNTIMVVPITVGSGIRMKILEAASLGIPFVSTSVGAEGLPFEKGRDCFIADTPESFVKAIIDLKDKSLREKFAQNANAIVKEKYSMEALRRNRLEIYDKVLNEKN